MRKQTALHIKHRSESLKGHVVSKETREKIRIKMLVISKGQTNGNWKGDFVKYSGLHKWLRDNFGKANKCENENCPGKSKNFDYAKIKGKKYLRRRENFMMMCHPCHKQYDSK